MATTYKEVDVRICLMKLKILSLFAIIAAIIVPVRFVAAQEQTLPDVGSYSADALSARLAALRELYRIKLSDSEKERLVTKCDQAQDGLQKISNKLLTTKTGRSVTYDSVIASLISLRALVVTKQVDPSNIELLIVEYQQKKEQFDLAVSDYQVTLDDSINVDCKTRPEEFRAALEGVRDSRKKVVNASTQIDEITKSNLKTAFDTLRSRLLSEAAKNGN